MPEGPECRYIAQSLHGICQGSTVDRLDIFSGRYLRHGPPEGWKEFTNELTDNAIKLISIASHGKFLYWKFSNNWYLWNTLGMSGQWSLQGEADDPHHHLRIRVITPPGKKINLWWRDIRNFGSLKLVKGEDKIQCKLNSLGIDILNPEPLSTQHWISLARKYSNLSLPKLLMDQKILAGVGNYLKAEALYQANISPLRKVDDLDDLELELLYDSIRDIARKSFEANGASFSTYSGPKLEKGLYGFKFQIYGKLKDPYGHPVLKYKSEDGRTTHWVKETQV